MLRSSPTSVQKMLDHFTFVFQPLLGLPTGENFSFTAAPSPTAPAWNTGCRSLCYSHGYLESRETMKWLVLFYMLLDLAIIY